MWRVFRYHRRAGVRLGRRRRQLDPYRGTPSSRAFRGSPDAVMTQYPMLRGTIRDHVTQERRPFLRFFACAEDYSLEPPDTPLPDAVASGAEPLLIIGAIAGG